MTAKLKEKIIVWSRKKRSFIFAIGILIVSAFAFLFLYIDIPQSIFTFITLMVISFTLLLDSLKKYSIEVIRRNKLLYLILSDQFTVGEYLIIFIFLPLVNLSNIKFTFVTVALALILAYLIIDIISDIISTHFEKNLSYTSKE